ncbi:MAG: HlyD family efflux transporter periplasmic adaptor subunit, partial [Burkholderiaceae bacterium]
LELPLSAQLRRRLSAWFESHGKGRHRLAAAAGALALALLMCWPVDHDIAAPVKLEGAVERIITSPGDNYLQKVWVRPGDVVKAGQVLLEFATEDLLVERQRLLAGVGGHDAAAGDAAAKENLSELAIETAKADEARAQLALLDQRLARARVVAPFDAVVIQGDLTNALGAPMKRGDALMTLAPANDFRAIVDVDDADILQVQPGQTGAVVLTALPDTTLQARVLRVTPLETASQGRSYFEVQVDLSSGAAAHSLRPGMRGIARLHGPKRAMGIVWAEKAVVWVRLAWWRWVG